MFMIKFDFIIKYIPSYLHRFELVVTKALILSVECILKAWK